ncbi:MAG: hypothetical protein HZY75_13230 [Nocardioidaceae bacterium]|nr:MAG: hypothetical protein HZY75_13230 [Nocardioidaceae bacterium]
MSFNLPPKWCGVTHSHAAHQWSQQMGEVTALWRYCPGSICTHEESDDD